jgi:hypothetical protein
MWFGSGYGCLAGVAPGTGGTDCEQSVEACAGPRKVDEPEGEVTQGPAPPTPRRSTPASRSRPRRRAGWKQVRLPLVDDLALPDLEDVEVSGALFYHLLFVHDVGPKNDSMNHLESHLG